MDMHQLIDVEALDEMVPARLLGERYDIDVHGAEVEALEHATIGWGDLHPRDWDYSETVEVVTIRNTSWGDYSGGTVERSNCRVILEEYSDYVIEVGGAIGGGTTLAVRLDRDIPKELFTGLVYIAEDYPVWDESDHQMLEDEIVQECWSDYAQRDFRHAMEKAVAAKFMEDNWAEPVADDVAEAMVAEMDLTKVYYEAIEDSNDYPYCETATSAVFPDLDEVAKQVANKFLTRLTIHPDQGTLHL